MQAGSSRQEEVRAVLQRVKSEGRTALSPLECSEVLRAYGVPLPREGVARSAAEAADLAADIGFPVVMKIVSEDILHKTEAGGVLVGVADREQAERGYQTLMDNARAYKAEAVLTGVQVQQQVSRRSVEVIVGAVTDPSFGKVVAFGLGGVLVEVLRDVTFRLAPAVAATRPCPCWTAWPRPRSFGGFGARPRCTGKPWRTSSSMSRRW